MWSSKDLTLVIITAVVVFVFTALVFQFGTLITGITGANYIFTFGMAMLVSLTFLLFEGRRWRFFVHNLLVAILTMPTTLGGPPFDVIPRIAVIVAGIPTDLILNSIYMKFKQKNHLSYWSILTGTFFFLLLPFIQILTFPLIFPASFIETFKNTIFIMLPWIIGGGIIGGYFGFKIYLKIINPNQ